MGGQYGSSMILGKLFDEIRKNGMDPIVRYLIMNYHIHFINEYGSWRNRKMIDFYLKYCEAILKRYHNKVKYWLSFNEINNIHIFHFSAGRF